MAEVHFVGVQAHTQIDAIAGLQHPALGPDLNPVQSTHACHRLAKIYLVYHIQVLVHDPGVAFTIDTQSRLEVIWHAGENEAVDDGVPVPWIHDVQRGIGGGTVLDHVQMSGRVVECQAGNTHSHVHIFENRPIPREPRDAPVVPGAREEGVRYRVEGQAPLVGAPRRTDLAPRNGPGHRVYFMDTIVAAHNYEPEGSLDRIVGTVRYEGLVRIEVARCRSGRGAVRKEDLKERRRLIAVTEHLADPHSLVATVETAAP